MAHLLTLAVLAGLSTNVVLHLGIGVRELALPGKAPGVFCLNAAGLRRLAVLPVSVLALWSAVTLAGRVVPLGLGEYVLAFPLGLLAAGGWDRLFGGFCRGGRATADETSFCGAAGGAALFVTLSLASNFGEAAVLALGNAGGVFLAFAVVAEIKRRAGMEPVPEKLRGTPVALVAMGILSLVFSSAAFMFLGALG